jgi:2-hydroxychromene-2-carboxylate isomerase
MSPRAPRAPLLLATLALGLGPASAGPPGREPGQVVRIEHRDPDTAPTRGPASARVTIEYFFHPNTNASARLASYRLLERLQANHPTRIRLIFRIVERSAQVQLPTVALEAHAQGKFFDLMEELHVNKATLGRPEVLDLARRIGLDVPRVAAAITNARYRDVLEANNHRLERITRGQITVPAVLFNAKLPRTSLSSMGEGDYEREFNEADDRAWELIERGVNPRFLMEAFDTLALSDRQPYVASPGPTDPDLTGDATDHRLASPPLDVTGMPSFGKPDAKGAIPVILLCRPNDAQCEDTMNQLRSLQKIYPDEVRLVWAPWFDVSRDDAVDLTLLGDAALCAEEIGSSPEDLRESSGWRWVDRQLKRAARAHGRRATPEKLIDDVAAELRLDGQQLSACRARMANATIEWIERARRSGVTRAPALVIGGRIYEGIANKGLIQQLVEAELAPGVLGELAPAWPHAHP